MRKFLKYIRAAFEGEDGKLSLRALLATAFSIDFIRNLSHAIWKWDAGRSLEGLSLVLGIEAGLIVSLLGITAWSNMTSKKIDADITSPTTPIKVANVENITLTKEPIDAK